MIISHTKGRGKKIHIFIDDEYQITTDIDFWATHYFKDGTVIDEDAWNDLVESINYKKAVDKCYDLLSRRDHSVKELRVKLLKTVDENSAEKAIDRMIELGYLDDEKYARTLVKYLIESKKMSYSFIKQEMYKRGIDSEIITNTLEEVDIDSVSNIIDLIQTKYRNKLISDDGTRKVTNALMRKGYSYSDIKTAFSRIENGEIDE